MHHLQAESPGDFCIVVLHKPIYDKCLLLRDFKADGVESILLDFFDFCHQEFKNIVEEKTWLISLTLFRIRRGGWGKKTPANFSLDLKTFKLLFCCKISRSHLVPVLKY